MYLKDLLILNSGPIEDLEIHPEFDAENRPKPLILVGRNGSGKTNVLSVIADGLIEIAARKFNDIKPLQPTGGKEYFRMLGSITTRAGAPFELCLLHFEHQGNPLSYRSKAGEVAPEDLAGRLDVFPGVAQWKRVGDSKVATGEADAIERVFRAGTYVFFPSSRAERPFWSVSSEGEPEAAVFEQILTNILRKPITIERSIKELKPWIIDALLDQSVDPNVFFQTLQAIVEQRLAPQEGLAALGDQAAGATALRNLVEVIRAIVQDDQAQVLRMPRQLRNRRLTIRFGDGTQLPSLDSFSAGQSTLLSIFGTIIRYADTGQGPNPRENMEGIVLVDEIDAHLHADLQHDVLPKLMKLFPRIQFIVSSHSPLFPLGMEKEYGEAGFTMVELPAGTILTAERYSEFLSSFIYLQDTRAFETELGSRMLRAQHPQVVCEGATDPEYLNAAIRLLGYGDPFRDVTFEWIGVNVAGQAKDGGAPQLVNAAKVLTNNPAFVPMPTVLLFDHDNPRPELDAHNIRVRTLPKNTLSPNTRKGIENLLPNEVVEARFFSWSNKEECDSKLVKVYELTDKVGLCKYVCEERNNPADFEAFRPALEMLVQALGLEQTKEPEGNDGP